MIEYKNLLIQREKRFGFENIVGKSDKMMEILDLVKRAAPSRSTVLIHGASGTGKELIAGAIHMNSNRADKAFVVVNSSTIPSELLEATLFGHTKGAFTGAITSKKGLFKAADGGTIFFDEIGNIGLDIQAKLLRVMQERSFIPIGSTETVHVDVRIIAATNIDLEKAMLESKFKEDLFYRLNVINIKMPSLAERPDDIPLLVGHFMKKYCDENSREMLDIDPEVMKKLITFHWPGNVRELENIIERGTVLAKGSRFTLDLLPDYILNRQRIKTDTIIFPQSGLSLKEEVQKMEIRLIKEALKVTGGVQKDAAKLLTIKPTTLHEMMRRLKIEYNPYETTS
jgi:two-component system response regulator PilR (NtrC family)